MNLHCERAENQLSWDRLAFMGCDVAQGYYLTRPISADRLTAWLNEGSTGEPNTLIEAYG